MKRLSRLAHVIGRTSLSRSKIYELMQDGRFPKPVKIGRINHWVDEEIDAYIDGLVEAREVA